MHPVAPDPDDQGSKYKKAICCSDLPEGEMTIGYYPR
jgi:hypothetical protein